MPSIKCAKCGATINNVNIGSGTIKYQHCGHVVKIASKDSVKTYSTNMQESKINIKHKPKTSILSILSLIFSILGITFWLGIILSIIDLCKPNRKKVVL